MMSGFTTVGYFLFSLFFSIATFVLWLRLALTYFRVSTLHSLHRNVIALTEPFVKPVVNLLPKQTYKRHRYDLACFTLLLLVEVIKFLIFSYLFLTNIMPLWLLTLYVLGDLIVVPCNILFYAIMIRVIMSFINPRWHNPLEDLLRLITDPLLLPIRRHVPVIGNLDISPYLALILLKSITLFITASLPLHLI